MKTAKLFRSGRSQAVRLPKEFHFEGNYVSIKKMGNAVILISTKSAWETLFASLHKFSNDFMEDRNQPEHQSREDLIVVKRKTSSLD